MNITQKETGLLFHPDMARANVAGLKTMTRRRMKIQPRIQPQRFEDVNGREAWAIPFKDSILLESVFRCPYGQPGDLLYQKESFLSLQDNDFAVDLDVIYYRADGSNVTAQIDGETYDLSRSWTSSLFMPKKAARFWAEIVSIKVERVRDISAEDCIKEGLSTTLREHDAVVHLRDQYRDLYNRINGSGSFDRDWCWVIEYRRVER